MTSLEDRSLPTTCDVLPRMCWSQRLAWPWLTVSTHQPSRYLALVWTAHRSATIRFVSTSMVRQNRSDPLARSGFAPDCCSDPSGLAKGRSLGWLPPWAPRPPAWPSACKDRSHLAL